MGGLTTGGLRVSAFLPGNRPFAAFFALFLPSAKSRKRRKKAFFRRYPPICLNTRLLNPHLRHSKQKPSARIRMGTSTHCRHTAELMLLHFEHFISISQDSEGITRTAKEIPGLHRVGSWLCCYNASEPSRPVPIFPQEVAGVTEATSTLCQLVHWQMVSVIGGCNRCSRRTRLDNARIPHLICIRLKQWFYDWSFGVLFSGFPDRHSCGGILRRPCAKENSTNDAPKASANVIWLQNWLGPNWCVVGRSQDWKVAFSRYHASSFLWCWCISQRAIGDLEFWQVCLRSNAAQADRQAWFKIHEIKRKHWRTSERESNAQHNTYTYKQAGAPRQTRSRIKPEGGKLISFYMGINTASLTHMDTHT